VFKTVLSAAALLGALTGTASATIVTYSNPALPIDGYATSITYDDAALRGSTNDRDNPDNALGATDGDFFEIGYGSTVDLTFGTLFRPSGTTVEITNGTRGPNTSFFETITVFFGINGVFTQVATLTNAGPNGPLTLTFSLPGGPSYDTIRFVDTTVGRPGPTGGWDIDSVRVSPVPLPAAGLLLLAGLGGLAALRRRKALAA
jgi:hypothetical protein